MFQLVVNVLGTLTVGLCAVLLLRAYASVRKPLLLWSGMCFTGLMAANALLLVEAWLFGESLYTWRLGIAAISMLMLAYGLIFESDQP
jgi:hypothetical protein